VVACVESNRPSLRLVVKLENRGKRLHRHLDAIAAIARMVRTNTGVPTFEVVAVDVSGQTWPWNYLIVTHISGVPWARVYPHLDDAGRAVAQRQIGVAAAHLHALRFPSCGPIGGDGRVREGDAMLPALVRRMQQRIKAPRLREFFLHALEPRAHLFAGLSNSELCHEDLNPNNLLFRVREGQPELSGVLDFESSWAGTGESDVARLEFWRLTACPALLEGYTAIRPLAEEYAARRPLLQLLWCLEFAQSRLSAQHQADTDAVCRALAISPIRFEAGDLSSSTRAGTTPCPDPTE
jgi:Ser/Thr protein kinase RdoA (MazF antagonist)